MRENSFRLWLVSENLVRDEKTNMLSLPRLRPSLLLKNESNKAPTVENQLETDRNIVFVELAVENGVSCGLLPYNDSS